MTTSFIVTGKNGQLGRCLVRSLGASPDCELRRAFGHAELDIADRRAVMRLFESLAEGPPDWLVNAAAFTAVDLCESEPEASMAVNGEAPGHLAEACREAGVAPTAGLVDALIGDVAVVVDHDHEDVRLLEWGGGVRVLGAQHRARGEDRQAQDQERRHDDSDRCSAHRHR